ncbi:MAG TPA: holo-[acyl-carrier-protein] synthase [Candidatus Marinimicrobia bacterium]|jgi:holo-[acyl-carrier protein] synthase|nr:holo-[acyl-carrier-protein] synthase [Candidatus Neomarinimicrobiota bacterium]MDP6500455.1 holo-ACP synthase [Candidatus Neomarinimicrobiota bacterium]MDP6726625.1 holo-ACP synthase [Candidatus Neomarinimicrobiota bacterium]HBR87512.1 holo-[acyl-carrier-protein] synthase [Candidatus Neomarinimicrobiota bacterium]|tara:strand:+ start:1387 stop:1755 length:369 start_codon:yes stop_codon:yes gene_type:complete
MQPDIFIGTDIVDVSRIRQLIDDHSDRFIERTYTDKEQSYCAGKSDPAVHYSGRFAAKEAIKKALMTSGITDPISWVEMEIVPDHNGAPIVNLHGNLFANLDCKVSISHTQDTAISTAVIIK